MFRFEAILLRFTAGCGTLSRILGIVSMPKVVRDERLAARVHAFIEQRGSVSAAAAAMGVSRTLLWRFDRTGRAIDRTRGLLAAALERYEKETASAESATSAALVPTSVSVDELIAMRAFFQNMLNVIDAYVANPSSSAAMAG
ncbi:MAG: hypothetical protein ACN6OP_30260, partial [Pseudomonadales bacterium]